MTTKTHMIGTTTAEADALAATAAMLAAGKDPFGDDDETTVVDGEADTGAGAIDEADDQAAAGEKSKDEAESADDALSAEALAAIAADETPAETARQAKRYDAGDPAEFKTKRTEQIGIKAKALKDLMDGVIEPEEYSRIEAEVADSLDVLTVQRTLHEANVQTDQQTQESALDKIITAAKKSGEVDYRADAKAAKQFDTAMKMLTDDGETRSFAELAADAHSAVLAIRGIRKVAPTAAEAAATLAAKPRENGKGPMTLRNLPAAEIANSGGGWKDQLATLSGQAYEEAFAKLSAGQRSELMND
jgi:hypothetical protein